MSLYLLSSIPFTSRVSHLRGDFSESLILTYVLTAAVLGEPGTSCGEAIEHRPLLKIKTATTSEDPYTNVTSPSLGAPFLQIAA